MHCHKVSYSRGWIYLFFGMKTFCGAQFHALSQSVLFNGMKLLIPWNKNILSSPVSCTVAKRPIEGDEIIYSLEWKHFVEPSFMHSLKVSYSKGMKLFILWNENILLSPVSCTVVKCPIQWDEIIFCLKWKHFDEPSCMHCRKVSYLRGNEIIYSLEWNILLSLVSSTSNHVLPIHNINSNLKINHSMKLVGNQPSTTS